MNKIAVFMNRRSKEYFSYICRGFEDYMNDHPVSIHMYLCFGKLRVEEAMSESAREIQYGFYHFPDLRQYDGVILPMVTMMDKHISDLLLEKIRAARIPCVMIEQECEGMSWVGINQGKAIREITAHMINQHGVSKICYLGGQADTFESDIRKKAFLEELADHGIKPDWDWIIDGKFQYEDGMKLGKSLLEEFDQGAEIPHAVVCANDEIAAGLYDTLTGTKLEGKVCVSGFDYYRNGEYYRPHMTTIERPRETMGYESCRLMERMISKGDGWTGRTEMDYRLIIGQTCGCSPDRICDESATVDRLFTDEHLKDLMMEQLDRMMEQTTRDISSTELADGIRKSFESLGGSYLKIMVPNKLLVDGSADYNGCNDVLLEWSKDTFRRDKGEFLVFTPLHFQYRIMGYACMAGVNGLVCYGLLELFIRDICFSMENYMQKKRYQELFVTDQLTGLYNRFGLKKYGEDLYEKNSREQKDTEIIFCDINKLKYINDTFGHQAGDWAICAVGKALRACQTNLCLPFRIGGDEYIVLAQTEDVHQIISNIKQELETLQRKEPQEYHVSISIGSFRASWEEHAPLETYYTKADEVMYREKQKNRSLEN